MQKIVPEYHNNPAQRTPCLLVLDASGSMGEVTRETGRRRIDELNAGLALLQQELQADEAAAHRVQLAIVCVGGPAGAVDLLMNWTDAMQFQAPRLSAGGRTPLGKGMRLALEVIDQQKRQLRENSVGYTRPWIIVISDGEPTDAPTDWQAATQACRAAEAAKRCVIYPIAVAEANMTMLQQLSVTEVIRLSEARFREYFQWLSSSLASMSRSRPGHPVQLAAASPWASLAGGASGPWAVVSA
jgi:uncharacterized protein YegL